MAVVEPYVPTCKRLATTDPLSEAHRFGFGGLQAALRLRLRLHGVNHNMPSQMARVLERWQGCWNDGKGAGATSPATVGIVLTS